MTSLLASVKPAVPKVATSIASVVPAWASTSVTRPVTPQVMPPIKGTPGVNMSPAVPRTSAVPMSPATPTAPKLPVLKPVTPAASTPAVIPQALTQSKMLPAIPNTQAPNMSSVSGGSVYVPPKPVVPSYSTQQAPGTVVTPTGLTVNPNTGGVIQPTTPIVPSPDQAEAAAREKLLREATGIEKYGDAREATDPSEIARRKGIDETSDPMFDHYGDKSTPTTPAVPDVTKYEKDYQDSLTMSPEEQGNQQAIDNLETSYETAYTNAEGQPIPLDFITGQQRQLENRKLGLSAPLLRKAALLQAKRTAAIDASKFALERADKEISASKEDSKPISVGEGTEVIQKDPTTGTYKSVFNNPSKTSSKVETSITEANGRRLLVNTQTGETVRDLGSTTEAPDLNKLLTLDEATKLGVPYGTTVGDAMGASPKNDAVSQQTTQALDAVSILEGMPGLNAAVGAKGITNWLPGTAAADFKAQLDRVKSLLTLPALQQLRGLGAMSDREFNTLSSSVAALNTSMSESAFRTELARIKDALQTTAQNFSKGPSNNSAGNTDSSSVGWF